VIGELELALLLAEDAALETEDAALETEELAALMALDALEVLLLPHAANAATQTARIVAAPTARPNRIVIDNLSST
jgi:hypothetical protein